MQHHDLFAIEMGVQFLDAIKVNNGRAVNSRELFWIQPCLQIVQAFAQQMRFFVGMELGVIVVGFNPVDALRFSETSLGRLT
jgi:hypothetical protein